MSSVTDEIRARKAELRERLVAQRAALNEVDAHAGAQLLARALGRHPLIAALEPGRVLAPTQHGAEIDPTSAIRSLLAQGWTLLRPRTRVDENDLDPIAWPVDAPLTAGRWGVREPPQSAALMSLEQVDLVLVPGVAFDAQGHRLGMGSGVFDRFLARLRAARPGVPCIGIGYEFQLVPTVPYEAHDMPLDGVQAGAQAVVRSN